MEKNSAQIFSKRQKVLADFGDFALQSEDLDEVLTEACRLVAGAMTTRRSKVLEIQPGGRRLLVRAAVGWRPDIIGKQTIEMNENSSESFSINERRPVVSQDITREARFDVPAFMREEGVVALANVPILLPGGRAYGLLQVDDTEPHEFDDDDTEFLRTYATILGPVVDRLFKLRDLRDTEQRFRLTVEAVQDYAILVTDRTDRITEWLPGAAAIFGWTQDEAIGQSGSILFTGEDRRAGVDREEIEMARQEGMAPNRRWHLRKDGALVFIDGSVRALKGENGELTGFIKVGQDTTSRRASERRLHRSEERLRLALDAGHLATWDWDLETGEIEWSKEYYRQMGYAPGEIRPDYDVWLGRVHPDDREMVKQQLVLARDRKSPYKVEYRIQWPDGAILWCHARGTFFYRDDATAVRMIGVQQDVTDQRDWQERQKVLLAELQHRTRNLMGVVRSISEETLRNSEDLADFGRRFRQRVSALSRAQALLSRLGEGDRVTFRQLVDSELAAVIDPESRDSAVTLKGPEDVPLRSSMVQILALAIHELCTNALKYGALRQPEGRLSIGWTVQMENGRPWLHVDWRETGIAVPAEGERPKGGGAGRELIERALPYQLGARTAYAFEKDGLHCTIALPASRRSKPRSTADD